MKLNGAYGQFPISILSLVTHHLHLLFCWLSLNFVCKIPNRPNSSQKFLCSCLCTSFTLFSKLTMPQFLSFVMHPL